MTYSPPDRCTDCGKFQDCTCVDTDACVWCGDDIELHDRHGGCLHCGCTRVIFHDDTEHWDRHDR